MSSMWWSHVGARVVREPAIRIRSWYKHDQRNLSTTEDFRCSSRRGLGFNGSERVERCGAELSELLS